MTPFDPILHFLLEVTEVSLHAKFEVSSFNGYWYINVIPKFQNWVTWHLRDPFWPNFAFLSLELTAIRLRAKFEVSSFNHLRYIRVSQNSKIGSRDPHMTPFDPILHFLLEVIAVSLHAKFEDSGFNHLRDIRGSQNSKIVSRDPHVTPFDPILHFIHTLFRQSEAAHNRYENDITDLN